MGVLRGPADGERAAGVSSRAVTRVQGHLPALPDDARPPGGAQGRLGLPRAARGDRSRTEASDHKQGRNRGPRRNRDRAVQRRVPRVGVRVSGGVEPADRADRLLDRPRRRVPHAGRVLHRVGVVGARGDRPAGAAVRGAQGRALLLPLRHRTVLARGSARVSGRGRSNGVRAAGSALPRRAAAGCRQAADLDDDAVDAAGQRRGRGRT